MNYKVFNGWNSFDGYNWSVTEEEFKDNTDVVDKEFKAFGYNYVVLDFIWFMSGDDPNPNPHQDENLNPVLFMDEYGRLIPSPERFPSSLPENSLKPIADYVHSKGLKFGLHAMRGIPVQAVKKNLPIKGTKYSAADVAVTDIDDQCIWLNHMYGLDMDKPGAQEYLNSIFELYASWEVDFIKVDDMCYPYHKKEIEGYRKAIDGCGRDMVLSLSPGPAPVEEAKHLCKYADMWRISADFWDNWDALHKLYGLFIDWMECDREGHYPDGDMIPFSKLALRGPIGDPRYSDFTHDEKQFLVSLLCFNNSPLMMGGDLTVIDEDAKKILTNPAILAVQKFGKHAKKYSSLNATTDFWTTDDRNNKDIKYCAVFNTGETMSVVDLPISEVTGWDSYILTDLWDGNITEYNGSFKTVLRPHSAAVYMVIRK